MTPLADMIPGMTDADLTTLRANASRLVEHGAAGQVLAASEIIPVIDLEVARRASMPRAAAPAKKRVVRKKAVPVTGHQTALT